MSDTTSTATTTAERIELDAVMDRLTTDLKIWLDQPGPEDAKVSQIRAQIEAMKDRLGAEAVAGAIRSLSGADETVRRKQQQEAAERLAAALRPLGIRLSPQGPAKRRGRKPGTRAAKPQGEQA